VPWVPSLTGLDHLLGYTPDLRPGLSNVALRAESWFTLLGPDTC
jgi:hypothetical protein